MKKEIERLLLRWEKEEGIIQKEIDWLKEKYLKIEMASLINQKNAIKLRRLELKRVLNAKTPG